MERPSRVTWTVIEDALFPHMVEVGRAAHADVDGLRLRPLDDGGRALVRVSEDGVLIQWCMGYRTAREAWDGLTHMLWAWALVP